MKIILQSSWKRWRTNQSRSLVVVLQIYWQRKVLYCRYILANRNWRTCHYSYSICYSYETRISCGFYCSYCLYIFYKYYLFQSFPFFGVKPTLLDEAGTEIKGEGEGYLVFTQPWPGMMRTLFNNHPRYEETYFSKFPGYYCTGDGEFEILIVFCLYFYIKIYIIQFHVIYHYNESQIVEHYVFSSLRKKFFSPIPKDCLKKQIIFSSIFNRKTKSVLVIYNYKEGPCQFPI